MIQEFKYCLDWFLNIKKRWKCVIKQSAPDHVIKYCYKDNSDCFYSYLCETYEGDYSNVYKLKCSCNCKKICGLSVTVHR